MAAGFPVDLLPAADSIAAMRFFPPPPRHRARILSGATRLLLALASLAGVLTPAARADVRLHALFTDNMVLQRGMPVTIWGTADADEKVTVKFQGQTVRATVKDGKWSAKLSPLLGNTTPDVLTAEGKNKVQVNNVLVGEVWLCSGQSNMDFPLHRATGGPEAMEAATNSNLRLFFVPRVKADAPLAEIKSQWLPANALTTSNFSAVAYFFGRDLQRTINAPLGLIQASWGGTTAEAWINRKAIESNQDLARDLLAAYPAAYQQYQEARARYDRAAEELARSGRRPAEPPPAHPWKVGEAYNGMIAPLIPAAFRGVAWYQGEANVSRAWQYRTLLPELIRNWRSEWRNAIRPTTPDQGNFAFLTVQLAPFGKPQEQPGPSAWAELREAQLLASRQPKVGLIVTTDVGDENDIHPANKEPVGVRLAIAARGIAYGEKIISSGPIYRNLSVRDDKAHVAFNFFGTGLDARGGPLRGFAICGEDRRFVWARAMITGTNIVTLSSPEVKRPVAVRYGWADYPLGNLWNRIGLPASPFRTDDFPVTTQPKGATR